MISTLLCLSACGERNTTPCSVLSPQSAIIPVVVDWSESGLTPSRATIGDDEVHRLSIRLYPKSGGDVVVRFLEANLSEDEILVPVGSYSVIAINESVTDSYWEGAISFTDVDDFDLFAGELVTDEESSAAPPKGLVAWAIEDFEVTQNMAILTQGVTGVGDELVSVTLTDEEQEHLIALTNVVMTPRTRSLSVSVTTENLGSSQSITASVKGLSRRVNIATGATEVDPVSHSIVLDSFEYDSTTRADSDASGVASGTQLCFAHSDDYEDEYTLDLEIYLADGTKHEDEEQLSSVDIAEQVTSTDSGSDYQISHTISLPIVEGGSIGVEEWNEEETIDLN